MQRFWLTLNAAEGLEDQHFLIGLQFNFLPCENTQHKSWGIWGKAKQTGVHFWFGGFELFRFLYKHRQCAIRHCFWSMDKVWLQSCENHQDLIKIVTNGKLQNKYLVESSMLDNHSKNHFYLKMWCRELDQPLGSCKGKKSWAPWLH